MSADDLLRRLRGAVGNALVWGGGWFTLAFLLGAVLRVLGILPDFSWEAIVATAGRFGVVGGVAGGAFSAFISLGYRGKRLSELSWVRFAVGGAAVTALFVPVFLQVMNLLSGDGLAPMGSILDDVLWTALFGGAVAGGSLKIAQRSDALLPEGSEPSGGRVRGADRDRGALPGERGSP